MSLLHLDSSANRSEESVTRQLTALFANRWRGLHPGAGYRYRDLAAEPVAPLDTAYCALGRRLERDGLVPPGAVSALTRGPDERRQWALTLPLIAEVLAAGTVLIGAPMYNYGVPASLKAWIDRVTFPGAFTDPQTGQRLLRDTRIVVVTSRGGAYGRSECDFPNTYLRAYFTKQGVAAANIHVVTAELTLAGLVPRLSRFGGRAGESLAAARAELTTLASAGPPGNHDEAACPAVGEVGGRR